MNKEKKLVVIALMLVTFLAAFEGTVVSTAMPTIARDLNGYNLISWIFSAYLLTSAVSTPIYGKLSDLFGRKKIITIGIIIFLVGTTLSGLSTSMVELIIFRAIQGLGAGAILTLTYTIIGDLFETSEKAKMQGFLSTVWGVASILGPFVGGAILAKLSWHWIFFVNIPFGLVGMYMINRHFHEKVVKREATIDYLGSIFLTIAIVALLFSCLETGDIKLLVSLLIVSIVSFVIFCIIEAKAKEPIVPKKIFTKTTIIMNIVCFIASVILISIQSYMPIYTQNVLGYSPLISGLFLAPMSLAWFMTSFILAKTLPKYGEKVIIIVAIIILVVAMGIVELLGINTNIIVLIIAMFIIGFGFGGVMNTSIIVVQEAVEQRDIGVSTSTTTLIRTLGQTIGVAIFGAVMNSAVTRHFSSTGINGVTPDNLSPTNNIFHLSIEQIKSGFFAGVHSIFFILFIVAIITIIFALILPRKVKR
ncbi:MAG: MDR family MFS transporter [Clostridium sp.]|uniref:MDR family MFS transporter n=1 Tax=Clostridium sp. TaxID=1506 RepID=UPI003F40BE66